MSTKTKTVTKRQAEAVFSAFKKRYAGYDLRDAHLVYNWTPEGHPAICWEGGDAPYEWAICFPNTVKGTFTEAWYSFVLAIYPD